ncbi:hypothetical protein C6497_04870 [Candidatus Poribacteria bacterium]|nr:MAG: hypothetical protein C6497_04870 [Candidatus Poribacteria bacterium]
MKQFLRIHHPIFIILIFISFLYSCDYLESGGTLTRILRKLKFQVTEISNNYPSRLKKYDVLLLQDLKTSPIENEIKNIQDFVREGGILVVCSGSDKAIKGLLEIYDLKLSRLPNSLEFTKRIYPHTYFPDQPLEEIRPRTYFVIESLGRDITILYGTDDKGTVVTFKDGEGTVYFITSSYMFDENGLWTEENAAFLYNLSSTFPKSAHIGLAIDRYVSIETKPPNTFVTLVLKTPIGLAGVYLCILFFLFITLQGRRFGKPLDVYEENRRLSSEYVNAMTALYQKNNTRMDILQHIREKFRYDLGIRWRVNPNLDTTTFIDELNSHGLVDEEKNLSNLLIQLDATNVSESQLLNLAIKVDAFRHLTKLTTN